jgi:serine/threonine protein kinase
MATERDFHGWVKVGKSLGEGGQSEVFLVRSPQRQESRQKELLQLTEGIMHGEKVGGVIHAVSRVDAVSELGALKVFKIEPEGTPISPPSSFEPVQRLNNEIAALEEGIVGLPKLLDYDKRQRWIVTEYFPEGTLEHNHLKFKGKVLSALRAFRTLVQTVVFLHSKGYVHRDIKPSNVFLNGDGLVLGDFGIVFIPDADARVTRIGERVGPRDYIPVWAHLGRRLDNVGPNFDIYMLGKLLWSMVDGRNMYPRELHREPDYDYDLTKNFPNDPQMHMINRILDKCVVERERDSLLAATELLSMVDGLLSALERGGQLLSAEVPRPCRVCGVGFYQPEKFQYRLPDAPMNLRLWATNVPENVLWSINPFACDYCGHVAMFTRREPRQKKGGGPGESRTPDQRFRKTCDCFDAF